MKNIKNHFRKILLAVFVAVFSVGAVTSVSLVSSVQEAEAASYPSDFRYWSQGQSGYSGVRQVGCWIVAQAKLLYETGVDRSASFNPDRYAEWEVNNGLLPNLTTNLNQVNGGEAPSRYAKQKGKTLEYLGYWKADANQLWFNINAGYHTIVKVNGGSHYVYLDNEKSKATGQLYCDDSSVDNYWKGPRLLSSYSTWTAGYVYKINGGTPPPPENNPTWTNSVTSATDNNLGVSGRISFPSSKRFSKAGFQIWDAGGNLLKNFSEAANHNSSYMDIFYKNVRSEIGVDLKPGTTYTYQYYAVADGQTYYSSKYTAKTTGTSTFNPTWQESLTSSTSDNLKLRGTITLPSSQQFQKAGIKIWDNNGNVIKDYEENTTVRGTYMYIDYDLKNELGLSLKPGTYYNYQFRATVNNTVYQSPVYYRPTAWPDSTVNHGDFYGFIMNSTWNPLRAETDDNVVLGRETNGTFGRTIWYFKRNSDGSYTITSLGSGKALEVAGGANENSANVRVWPANGSNAQKWFVYRVDGKDVFKPACTNVRIMDVSGGSTNEGANIIIFDNHNTENQRFSIYKINEQTSYSIKADSSEIRTGQSSGITISDTKYAYNFKLHIVKPDGSETVVDNGEKNTYTFTETTPGTYKIYAEVKGPLNTAKGSASDKYCEIKVKPDAIAVEDVAISTSRTTLLKDETDQLKAFISPFNATNPKIVWSSSDESVVEVDSDGNLKAKKKGTATVTATTEDGGKTASCFVTVEADPILEGVEIENGESITMIKGSTETLSAKVLPDDAEDKTVTWFSDNNDVAEADENGNVKAIKPGKATITAATAMLFGPGGKQFYFQDKIEITVVDEDKVEINEENFPDAAFRQYISDEIDTDKNGFLNTGEIEEASNIDIERKGIENLKGIEFFTELKYLSCAGNKLTSIDVSNNEKLESLDCDDQRIKADTKDKKVNLKEMDDCFDPDNVTELEHAEISGNELINLGIGTLFYPQNDTYYISYRYSTGFGDQTMLVYINGKIDVVNVRSVSLDPFILTINEGESEKINVITVPVTATNKNVSWQSDNPDIVSVDNNGNIKGLKQGKATITAVAEDGGKTDTCRVTVKPRATTTEATGISLDKKLLIFDKGQSEKLTATVTPDNATDKNVAWSSSDENVASVDQNGNVTAVNHGFAKITAKTSNGNTAECGIAVNFIDVTNPSEWYYKAVYWAHDNGIVTGSNGRFQPSAACTREQAVTFLWRMMGKPEPKSMVSKFSDVKDSKRYSYKAIMWGTEKGIISGTKGKFYPDATCTREQIVAMIWRLAGKPSPKKAHSKFRDVRNPKSYSYKAVMWAEEQGIALGSGGRFKPGTKCKRRDIVTFIYRYKNCGLR